MSANPSLSNKEIETFDIPRDKYTEITESFFQNSPYQNFLLLHQVLSGLKDLEEYKLLLRFLYKFCTHKYDISNPDSISETVSNRILEELMESIKDSINCFNSSENIDIRNTLYGNKEKNIYEHYSNIPIVNALYSKRVRAILQHHIETLPDTKSTHLLAPKSQKPYNPSK